MVKKELSHLSHTRRSVIVSTLFTLLLGACSRQNVGTLYVSSERPGTYEIYNIIQGGAFLEYDSEMIGEFNEEQRLAAGQYLLLTDCSHKVVILRPGQKSVVKVNHLDFEPPHAPEKEDIFSVQCDRYQNMLSRQRFSKRYSFNLMSGSWNILVGLQPFRLTFPELVSETENSFYNYKLAAIKVDQPKGYHVSTPFFISSVGRSLSTTQAQDLGQWQFLLPGRYEVSVNGTNLFVDLKAGERRALAPALLRIRNLGKVDLKSHQEVKGRPFSARVNNRYFLGIDETYPMLPGSVKIDLAGETKGRVVNLEANQVTEVLLRNLQIDLNCSVLEWECLGKREVQLYEKGKMYPFLMSHSDLPILFSKQDVEVELEGSRGIRYRLPKGKSSITLSAGRLQLSPRALHKAGAVTDLVRVEALREPLVGHSYDISGSEPSTLTLPSGVYHLARYTSYSGSEHQRSVHYTKVRVRPGAVTKLDFVYYQYEHKLKGTKNKTTRPVLSKKSNSPNIF